MVASSLALLSAVGLMVPASAQQGKSGEVIEASPSGTARFIRCTVVENRPADGGYSLTCEDGGSYFVPYKNTRAAASTTGAATTAATPTPAPLLTPTPAPQVTPSPGPGPEPSTGTVSAGRPILECPVAQPKAKASDRPPLLVSKVIRCLWERTAPAGSDGAVTIDLIGTSIGASRAWNVRTDRGQGRAGTRVWPIKTTYVWKNWYRTRTETTTNIGVFNCFVNTFSEWECGLAKRVKDGQPVSSARA